MATDTTAAPHAPAPEGEQLSPRAADASALAELFAVHGRRLERLAASLLRGTGIAPEDVVGDVFLRLAELLAVRPLPADEHVGAYLAQMVRHRCFDLRRRQARWGDAEAIDEERVGAGGSAEDAALRRERLDALVEDLGLLPERQRRALLDRCVGGVSHAEIAARQQVTEQTSRSLFSRALTNLRALNAAREAPCEVVRFDLGVARARGHRPTEDVRRHLRVCAPCRLADARARGAGLRDRAVAAVAGWLQMLAELLHGAAMAPVTKTLAVGAAAIAPSAGPLTPAPEGAPPERPAARVAPAPVSARVAPVRVVVVPERGVARAKEARERPAVVARAVPPEEPRTATYRRVLSRASAGKALDRDDRAALTRYCAAFGAKGLVGPEALTSRCDPAVLDTPQRRRKVARVEEARARTRARTEAERRAAQQPAPPPPAPELAPPPPAPASATPEAAPPPPAPAQDVAPPPPTPAPPPPPALEVAPPAAPPPAPPAGLPAGA